jgi:hypothetical protein
MRTTPVLLIIFNRPKATAQVFDAIRQQAPKYLYIAADGPRSNHANDISLCRACREIVANIDWDCEVKTLYRNENMGCGRAVSTAITWFFNQVEEGIILEDDCLPNPSFFDYCAELLHEYRLNLQVMMICGTSYQTQKRNAESYYFSKYVHVWGWATWKRAWENYNFKIFEEDKPATVSAVLKNTFSKKREYDFWSHNMQMIINGLDTWDYQWMYAIWKNKGLCAIPWHNMITNIGFGPDATHTFDTDSTQAFMKQYEIEAIHHPAGLYRNKSADRFEMREILIGSASKYYLHKIRSLIGRSLKFIKNG